MRKSLFLLCILIGLAGGAVLGLWRGYGLGEDDLRLDVLDVGQGDSVLLSANGSRILIDGGSNSRVLEELGEVLPLWDKEIDLLVLTHPHEDHVAGLVPVLKRFTVKAVLLSAPEYPNAAYDAFLEEIEQQGISITIARSNRDFQFGALTLDVLYPFESAAGEVFENVNNASVVIRAVYEEHEILLSGDAEQEVEAELVAAWKVGKLELDSDVLKAGHHGSRTSNSLDFLEAVSPEIMIISCGTGNDYGHPHEETLEKAEDLGIEVHRTDLEGRVTLIFD